MANNGSGQSGYIHAEVTITAGGVYVGGGIAGWTGGDSFAFAFKIRESGFDRPRANTTDGPNKTGVGGPVSIEFHGEGFFKDDGIGNAYPPVEFVSEEYLRVEVNVGFVYDMIVKVDKFKFSADVEDAVKWTLDGISDGVFSVNGASIVPT